MTIHREDGISMDTGRTVNITAGADIVMSAAGRVDIAGQGGVSVQKGKSAVNVGDAIDISSEHTRVQ